MFFISCNPDEDDILGLDLIQDDEFFIEKHIISNNTTDLNIKNFQEALNLGYKIIKIFPASKLGTDFINKLKDVEKVDIFFIGAGGIKTKNIKQSLKDGYNALAIGRELKNQIPDQDLKIWLKNFQKDNSICTF